MVTLRGFRSRCSWGPIETLRGMFLVLDSVQALNLASFCSLFWACFRERSRFCGLFNGGVLGG